MEIPQVDDRSRFDELHQLRTKRPVRLLSAIVAALCYAIACWLFGTWLMALTIAISICMMVFVAPWLYLLFDPHRANPRIRFSLAALLTVVTGLCGISFLARLVGVDLVVDGIVSATIVLLIYVSPFVLLMSGFFTTFQTSLRGKRAIDKATDLPTDFSTDQEPEPRRPRKRKRLGKSRFWHPWIKFDL